MSENSTAPRFEGSMFLYDKPALLSKEEHDGMGLSLSGPLYGFARDIRGLPIVSTEIQSVQKHYPVVFSDIENPTLVAVVGIVEERNLFVDDDGNWDANTYVPSYVRSHPFALAANETDDYIVIIDESSTSISNQPDAPFFDDNGELTAETQARVDLCGHFRQQQMRTQEFCATVRDLDLLGAQRVNQTLSDGKEEKLIDYVTIDTNKLHSLDRDTLQKLHQDGSLAAIFAMAFSLENWNWLIHRRNQLLGLS
ncbi:MAG: SapC family protein [Pseudomonadota bacterium]